MNVLIYFGNQLSPINGGTERVACLIADSLVKAGHNVEYLASLSTQSPDARQSTFLPDPIDSPSPQNIQFIKDYIRAHRIDVIINEGANTDSVFLFSHEHIATGVRIISHLHFNVRGEIDSFYKAQYLPLTSVSVKAFIINLLKRLKMPFNKWRAFYNKRQRYGYMYHNSDKIVVLSTKQATMMKRLIGLSESSKIEAVVNPLSFDIVKNTIPTEHEKTLLFVGRLDYGTKRVDRILKAWHMVSSNMPGWKLKIVGDGDDMDRLKKIVKTLSLRHVEFVGKADSKEHYRRASMLLLTSNHEGTPMVIPEAMSFGVVPVVMNNFSDAEMFIKTGFNGILTPAFDIKAFSEAIKSLSQDSERLKTMSDNCIKSIVAFSEKSDGLERWKSIIQN